MRLATRLVLLLLALPARAQTPGQCTLGRAQATLDATHALLRRLESANK